MPQDDTDRTSIELPKRRARLSTFTHGTIERRQQGCECDECLRAETTERVKLRNYKRLNPPAKAKRGRRR